jgi:phenylalanyl-tRNA synthetase beta chain
MNISYNWLRDLIDIDLSAEETAAQLTRVGLAVDGIHPHGDDHVIDIDLTSNRPDCLSHLGVARELRVITGKQISTELHVHEEESNIPYPAVLSPDIVKIEHPELCYRFTARIIRNVNIGPSPEWMVKRLEALGERSINNVADITNYVMLELGQPMHAFDLDKLAENRIVVRAARSGETIKTLDEAERKLDTKMLMICDAERPVAVGGVMGGFDSSITNETKNVLLEVAYFDRASIRSTSRKLNLTTEASYRFERGVDINNLQRASDRAAELICQLAHGKLGEFVDVYAKPTETKYVESPDISGAVKRLTGLEVPDEDCVRILAGLGFTIDEGPRSSDSNSKTFKTPSWRHDISIEEDLVEEVARHVGYENISAELPPALHAGEYQHDEESKRLIRRSLADQGFDEAMGYSFIDSKFDEVYEPVPDLIDERMEKKYIELQDSVIEGAVRMRPTLLPGLIESARTNFNQQNKNLRLFEIGRVFATALSEDGLPTEREILSMLVTGNELQQDRAMLGRELDFFDVKGAVESALESAGIDHPDFDACDIKHLRPGQSASISVNRRTVGTVGRLNEEITTNYKFRQPIYVAEIDLQTILAQPRRPSAYAPLPRFPSVIRDVSFSVTREMTFELIRKAIQQQQNEICRRVEFVDVYEGKGVAANQRSLTLRLEYRSDERTLIDDEVDQVHAQILRSVEDKLKIKQRF